LGTISDGYLSNDCGTSVPYWNFVLVKLVRKKKNEGKRKMECSWGRI